MTDAVQRLWVKVCGVRRAEDARVAVELGATHVGCVMADDSPRRATIAEACAVAAAVADRATVVLVFRRSAIDVVVDACESTSIRWVQLHDFAERDARRLEDLGFAVMRVHSLALDAHALPPLRPPPAAGRPAVLDVGRGGSGETFPWSLLGLRAPAHVFVAGGINPENIHRLLRHRPFGIDLSSGVETSPGVKDPRKLEQLFAVVKEQS